MLGGSRPWQAPEFSRTAYFKIEEAKRTDVYSFGMLLWRVFLDGDPFESLGDIEGKTPKEKRQSRNDAIGTCFRSSCPPSKVELHGARKICFRDLGLSRPVARLDIPFQTDSTDSEFVTQPL